MVCLLAQGVIALAQALLSLTQVVLTRLQLPQPADFFDQVIDPFVEALVFAPQPVHLGGAQLDNPVSVLLRHSAGSLTGHPGHPLWPANRR